MRIISKKAKIRKKVEIQENVIIGIYPKEGVVKIGNNSIIRSGTIIYSQVEIGERFQTGHNVLIREKTKIGNNVSIGTNTIIDGKVKIGNNVSIQSGVYIPPGSVIEDNVFLGPFVILTNDKYMINPQISKIRPKLKGPIIKKNAKIGANAILLPGIIIGENAVVGAGAVVTKNVAPNSVVIGVPARKK